MWLIIVIVYMLVGAIASVSTITTTSIKTDESSVIIGIAFCLFLGWPFFLYAYIASQFARKS